MEAQYVSSDGATATLTYPEGYVAPRALTIPRLCEGGTVQQYFYRYDIA